MLNEDYKDLLQNFSDAEVDCLIVGAYALAAHGFLRATMDLDIWVAPTPENAQRVYQALVAFGAPLEAISPEDFQQENTVFQIGVAPRRIDILSSVSGLQFDQAFANAMTLQIEGLAVRFLSREDLLQNKRAMGRTKDLADIEALERTDDSAP